MIGLLIMPVAVFLPIQYVHAQRDAVRDRRHRARRVAAHRVRDGGPDHPVGRAVPAARPRHRARLDLRVLRRARPAARSSRPLFTGAFGPRGAMLARRRPVDAARRAADPAGRRDIKPDLSARRVRAARRARRTAPAEVEPENVPAIQVSGDRLRLRPRAGDVRRRLRGAPRRGARAPGNERRGQVDDPPADRRARHAVARCRAAARHADHLRARPSSA